MWSFTSSTNNKGGSMFISGGSPGSSPANKSILASATGYLFSNAHFGIDHSKQFPEFKKNSCCLKTPQMGLPAKEQQPTQVPIVELTPQNNCEKVAKKIITINDIPGCKSKRKRRRRRRRKNKKTPHKTPVEEDYCSPRRRGTQRSISTSSGDSFVVFGGLDTDKSDLDSCASSVLLPCKKVRFASEDSLCETHTMVMWKYAYQAARKGPWEECARDRERFRLRVFRTGRILADILQPDHRAKIFADRFAEDNVLRDC